MKIRHFAIIAVLAATLIFSGCKTKKPSPDMTRADPGSGVMGSGAYGDGSGAGFGDTTGAGDPFSAGSGLGADGLENRDPNSMANAVNGIRGVIPSVFFDFDQAAIKASERPKLDQAYQHTLANPTDTLLLEGYCDWRGTAEYNLALGERRAASVRDYLVQLGVDPTRLQTSSKGDLEAAVNGTDADMANDRRVDIVIIK